MSKSGIYIITNLLNGKLYIGSAVNFEKRFVMHLWLLRNNRHNNIHLQRAWNKHGEDVFCFEKFLSCSRIDLIFFEQLTLDASITRYGKENIYNICLNTGSTLGRPCSEETKLKIGIKSKGRWTGKFHTEVTKERMSNSQKGRIITPEHRKKISESMVGNPGYWLGKKRPPRSKEWQDKLDEAKKGRIVSDETRKKISIASTGRISPFKGKPGTRLGIKNKNGYKKRCSK